jgi:magnesium chelatase family protein
MSIKSIIRFGSSGIVIDIECRLTKSLPGITIVGLGNKAIEESKERVRSALSSSRIKIPTKRIIINLAPADIPKESSSLDLAIAVAIMQAAGQIPPITKHTAIIGELGLSGSIRPVRGIVGKLLTAKKNGIEEIYIPASNFQQASLVPDIKIYSVKCLDDVYKSFNGIVPLQSFNTNKGQPLPISKSFGKNRISDVVGQVKAKRAIEIAAAGGHNLLLSGPPGTGKSMLAKTIISLLPSPNRAELLDITQVHSLIDNDFERLIVDRPFRSPHHSSSHIAIVGGGNSLRPGEISLAHRGVLFLDELPEFNRQTIEAMRQPLEDKTITISRAKDSAIYPADFILIATANPCPCGNYGSRKECLCTAARILQYNQKLSGPIIDRIDIHAESEEIDHSTLLLKNSDNDNLIKNRIELARGLQSKRFNSVVKLNANMTNSDIKKLSALSKEATDLLNSAATNLQLSARSYMRTIKVARTIADIDSCIEIKVSHIGEALQYRPRSKSPVY